MNEKIDKVQMPIFAMERLRFNVDGPGIRTLVCAVNCPLRCHYCLNARSWDVNTYKEPFSPYELYDAVRIDNLYFKSTGGGITFSGGEPLLYPEFLIQFAGICPDEWDIRVDTSLNIPANNLKLCVDIFSHFYVDIKTMDKDTYTRYTGGKLDIALYNLQYLLKYRGADCVTVRVPLIPGFNDADEQDYTASALRRIGVKNIDLFSYIPRKEGR